MLSTLITVPMLHVDEIAECVADAVRHSLSVDYLALLLIDDERGVLEPLGQSAEDMSWTLDMTQGFAGWVVEHSAPLRVNDVTQDPRCAEPISDLRSALVVPITVEDRVLGVVYLASLQRDAFSLDDEDLMMSMAQHLAVAIENAHLYQETERRLEEVSALYQLAQKVNASLNVQEVLNSVVWSLKRTMECRGCSIALLDPVDDVLEIRASAGVNVKWQRDFKLRLGEGVAGQVALEGKPIYVPDVSELEEFIFFDPSVRSLLTVPLTLQQRIIGTLTVDSDVPGAFSKADERLLTIAAAQAAMAIENARLYASLEQRAQNLAEAYTELKKIDRLRDEIVRNVSHELRTPLTFVKSYVELLLDESVGPLTDEQKLYLEIVVDKTDLVTRLVSDIMSLQQVEREPCKMEPVSIVDLARRALRGCAALASKSGLTLVEHLPDDVPLAIGDEDKLLQVFDNLLGNAIKFSPNGGEIVVSVEDAGTMIQTSVSDQGIGIPQSQHERIFERFYQVDGSARRRFGGTGLGLAIVRRILESHGGRVWVESEAGQGSTFYFTVPKYQVPQI